jgi:hypothetical protein
MIAAVPLEEVPASWSKPLNPQLRYIRGSLGDSLYLQQLSSSAARPGVWGLAPMKRKSAVDSSPSSTNCSGDCSQRNIEIKLAEDA